MSKRGIGIAIVVAAAAAVVLLAAGLPGSHRSLTVTVAGLTVTTAHGTTVGALSAKDGLEPRAGDLLSVTGAVLRRGAVPGHFAIDGRRAAACTLLANGDRITAVAGTDRTEPVERSVVRHTHGVPGDPQYFVDAVPGEQLVERGSVSHAVVSDRFRRTGAPRPERAVALTFDDGPSPQYTRRIVSTLHRLHVRATFFVIGYLVDEYPGLVRLEQRLGMTVGNHSFNHPEVPPFPELPAPLIRDEIALGDQALDRLGIHTALFRPPGGGASGQELQIAAGLGQRVVLWSVDPTDWEPGVNADEIAERVLAAVKPGSIVDLHDGGGDRSATLAALPAIVRGIRARHLKLVALAPGSTPVAITGTAG